MSGDERGLGENEKRPRGWRREMNEGGAATLHYTPREGPPEVRHLLRPEPGDTEMRPERQPFVFLVPPHRPIVP